jgi:large subunit ribosomal protein L9
MKIILMKAVENLGKQFDVITVRDGYARNYLFPRNLAMAATKANIRGLEKSKQRFSKKIEQLRKMSMGIAERINSTSIKTTLKSSIEGKAFGSITSQDLVELLKAEGIELDKKTIVLEEPLKHPGVYDIKVHLGEKIDAVFKVAVLEEGT